MKLGRLLLIGFMMAAAFGIFLGVHGTAMAEDAKLIRIHGVGEGALAGIFIDPETAYIKSDTIVVWLNGVKQNEVKVEFADGKKCKSVTAFASDFNLEMERACFVTSYVPFAATTSLQFTEPGEYEYKIIAKDSKVTATGKLVVE